MRTFMRAAANSGGVSKLAQALMMGDAYQQQGTDAMNTQMADVAYKKSAIAKNMAEADAINQRPQYLEQMPAIQSGMTLPQGKQVRDYLNSGSWGTTEAGNPDGSFSTVQAENTRPDFFTPQIENNFRNALASVLAAGGSSSSTPDSIMKGMETAQSVGFKDRLVNGQLTGPGKDMALALEKASPVYDTTASGITTNRYSGDLNTGAFDRKTSADNSTDIGKARIQAGATVEAARVRATEDNKMPAEAKLVDYYANALFGGDKQKAADYAKEAKHKSPEQLYLDAYTKIQSADMTGMTPEQIDTRAREAVRAAMDFGQGAGTQAKTKDPYQNNVRAIAGIKGDRQKIRAFVGDLQSKGWQRDQIEKMLREGGVSE